MKKPGLCLDNPLIISALLGAITLLSFGCGGAIAQPARPAPAATEALTANSQLRIATTDLHMGDIGQPYRAVLTATGGVAPYTWSVTGGWLPKGLSLVESKGEITGTPSAWGGAPVTVTARDRRGATASASFMLEIFEQPLDVYGGLKNSPSPHGGTGFFRVEKQGSRWTFVDPLGNDFWMLSVYYACPALLNPGVNTTNWAMHTNERLISWGFNTLGEYTDGCDSPISTWNQSNAVSPKMPKIIMINAAPDAMFRPHLPQCDISEAIKDIVVGVPGNTPDPNHSEPIPDVYDPKFATAYRNEVNYLDRVEYTGGFANSPWIIGITTDDADDLLGFKSQGNAPINYPDPAYLVAVARFHYTAAQSYTRTAWRDPKLYSKYAWINFLKQKYSNNIAALNRAWETGGFYTSFDDAGGYGTGRGVIDEDGRHTAWMGNDPYTLNGTHNSLGRPCNCRSASPGVQTDLNAFLYQFAKQYATVAVTAIRSVDKHHLIFGPAALNNHGSPARPEVLRGLSDGGIQVFQYNYDPTTGSMAGNDQSYDITRKPAFLWYTLLANADSPLAGVKAPWASPVYPIQAMRGEHYEKLDLPRFLNARGSDGDYYIVGIDWWDLYDSKGEGANFGLMTDNNNPYDGKADVIQRGADSWGFPTGGETTDFGDFLSSVRQANLDALRLIAVRH